MDTINVLIENMGDRITVIVVENLVINIGGGPDDYIGGIAEMKDKKKNSLF